MSAAENIVVKRTFFYNVDSTPLEDDVEELQVRSSECLVCEESSDVTESLSLLCGLE